MISQKMDIRDEPKAKYLNMDIEKQVLHCFGYLTKMMANKNAKKIWKMQLRIKRNREAMQYLEQCDNKNLKKKECSLVSKETDEG